MTDTYPIQGPRPTGSVVGLSMEQIRARLKSTDPENVAASGHAFNAAASTLSELGAELDSAIRYLRARWKSPAGNEALRALSDIQKTAQELSEKSGQTGKALQHYGEKILPFYKTHLPDDGYFNTAADDENAQRVMAKLNRRIAETFDGFPQAVTYRSRGIGEAGGGNFGSDSLGPGAGPGNAGTAPASNTPRAFQTNYSPPTSPVDPAGVARTGQIPSDVTPTAPGSGTGGTLPVPEPGSTLASAGSGVPSSPSAGLPTGQPGGGLGPGTAGPGGLNPTGGVFAPSAPGPAAGVRSGKPGTGGGRTGPASRGPGGMLPGPGAGQGQSDDRERQTTVWMPEDHATWTSDDEVAPPVIGDLDPKELGRTPPRPEEEANAHPTAESDLGNVEDASPVEESELLNALVNVDDVLDEVQQDLDSASRGDQRKGGSAGG